VQISWRSVNGRLRFDIWKKSAVDKHKPFVDGRPMTDEKYCGLGNILRFSTASGSRPLNPTHALSGSCTNGRNRTLTSVGRHRKNDVRRQATFPALWRHQGRDASVTRKQARFY